MSHLCLIEPILTLKSPLRVLKVNFAQPMKIKGGDKGWSHQAVWADADKYMEEMEAEQELTVSCISCFIFAYH